MGGERWDKGNMGLRDEARSADRKCLGWKLSLEKCAELRLFNTDTNLSTQHSVGAQRFPRGRNLRDIFRIRTVLMADREELHRNLEVATGACGL